MKLPLHDVHATLGARFALHRDVEVPEDYGDWTIEHDAARTRVVLADCSDHGRLRGSGPDVGQVLHGVVTNEVKHLPVGAGCLAALLNDVGRTRTLLVILRTSDGYLIETPPTLAEMSRDLVDYYIITEDAVIEDVSGSWGQLTLQGPQARSVLVDLLTADALPAADAHEYAHTAASLDGVPVRVVRRTRSGEDGYDVWIPAEHLRDAWSRLHAAVEAAGGRVAGRRALETLRIEASIPQFPDDIDETVIPLETGLMHAISENKGCYLGQEIIARIINLSKPVRTFVGLLLEDADDGAEVKTGDAITLNGKDVGRITSLTASPTMRRRIALGYLRTDLIARGVREVLVGTTRATVHPAPFHRAADAPVAVVPPSPSAPRLLGGTSLL